MNRKKKVVIFQSAPEGVDLTYKEMEDEWKYQLGKYEEIGEYQIIRKTQKVTSDFYIREIGDADAVMGPVVHSDFVNEQLFRLHPNLKYIATLDHGYGLFDIELTRRYQVTMTNTIYGDHIIAQFAMALLLEICHHVWNHSEYTKNQFWIDREKTPDMGYEHLLSPQIELTDKVMGIIGPGNIGRRMAGLAKAMGMHVIAFSRTRAGGKHKETSTGSADVIDEYVSFEELLERSDVISIHCPLTPDTKKMIDKSAFSLMKQGVILINTARGAIIDEDALLEALNSRKVYMAGLDVIAKEPPVYKTALMESPYTIITPHIAWQSRDARLRAIRLAVETYIKYLHGKTENQIN